ncbi:thrombospondin type 3 repeat-containing protein, partial [Candidatus Woesearchaeota archaeon]|nr:thrombospondin type 3 repeat-containing protein [Candidatus Woesearchaeota archaeon]
MNDYIDTPEEANNIRVRLKLIKIKNCHEKLYWALMNITYCGSISEGNETPSDINDTDGDGIPDEEDNCPEIHNPAQKDTDEDGIGDKCDEDTLKDNQDDDKDKIKNGEDNCPEIYNPEQNDTDRDGIGDVCDEIWGNSSSINTNFINLTLNETPVGSTYVTILSNSKPIVEFLWNESYPLVLSNISVYKQEPSDSRGALMVSGIKFNQSNETKTVYIDKILNKGKLCILDEENALISQINKYCKKGEIKINCPGTSNGYNCTITPDNRYKITGLKHSAVQETQDEPKSSGGGGSSTCKPDWKCTEWGDCDINGYKHRTCNDENNCNVIDGVPELSMQCSAEELCDNGLKDSGEDGIDCGGACEPCPQEVEEEAEELSEIVPEKIEVEEQTPLQIPVEITCKSLPRAYWLIYLFVIAFTLYSIGKLENHRKKKQNILLSLLIACNIIIILIIAIDLRCGFRWYISMLFIPPLAAIYVMLNMMQHK